MAHKQKIGKVHIHNRETEQVSSLIPFQLRGGSSTLITFLEDYYKYLNQKGQPTNVIDRIQYEHDIDLTDETYLEYLKQEIAKDVPNSAALDNRALLRNIVSFYKSRGSQGSISQFFKLFFNDDVRLSYPAEQLFKPSSGDIDVFGYSKNDGTKVFYNTTTKALGEAVPTGPTILTPDFVPSNPGYLKIGSNFENIFWTYGDYDSYGSPSFDKTFTIRVEKKTSDSGYQSPINSPVIPTSGFTRQTRLNLGDNTLSTNLTHDSAASLTIDISNTEQSSATLTYRLGTYSEDAPIYDKNLDTDEITFLQDINSPNEPYAKSFDLTDRHLYFGESEELGVIATGRNHTLLPTRAGGKYFSDIIYGSNDKETVYNFYAFDDAVISFYIDYEKGLNSPIRYSPTLVQKKRIRRGQYATFITNTYASPSDQHVIFFSSTGDVAGSTYTTNGYQDMTVLSPMSSDYVSRGDPNSPTGESTKYLISWDLTDSRIAVDNTTSVRHNSTDYSPATNSFVYGVVHVNDGLQSSPLADGNDKCQGIPVGYCNDTYLWPDGLSGYTMVSPYDDNKINIYQYDSANGLWDLYETTTPTKNIAKQSGSYSGDTSPEDTFIGPNSPAADTLWKFEGTYPFALWVNDNLKDEELVWGWNKTNYNLPLYTPFSTYNDRKGFVSDVNKIHDGERLQEFSYVIDTTVSLDRWKTGFYKLVHPAGLKLFNDISVEAIHSRADREAIPTWTINDPTWVSDLYTGLANHTPFYQPGWLDSGGNIDVFFTVPPFEMDVSDADVDQDLLSTYAIRYDTSTRSGVLAIRLTTAYVETNTNYVLMNTISSPQEYLDVTETLRTFESADNNVVTHSYVSWNTPIDSIDDQTVTTYNQPINFPVDSPQGGLSDVRIYLNSLTAVTEHQTPITVLERDLIGGDVSFPDVDSPLEQTITETSI